MSAQQPPYQPETTLRCFYKPLICPLLSFMCYLTHVLSMKHAAHAEITANTFTGRFNHSQVKCEGQSDSDLNRLEQVVLQSGHTRVHLQSRVRFQLQHGKRCSDMIWSSSLTDIFSFHSLCFKNKVLASAHVAGC